ncbi:ribosomal protein S3 [Culex quinquefasciatus]|uniref:Ribosomal protein S3 n=1 Tax=Culex quinquefasciatus TaxID=7176 RepID=B0W7A1_CULQU|nr:ribosomal protein S3 [Culex quinquefasciatus]|eukprot:XP_001844585.1 ribosomal protein S3 [Culex quinquefasciatus]
MNRSEKSFKLLKQLASAKLGHHVAQLKPSTATAAAFVYFLIISSPCKFRSRPFFSLANESDWSRARSRARTVKSTALRAVWRRLIESPRKSVYRILNSAWLAAVGYFGVEFHVTPNRSEIIITTRTQNMLGEKRHSIRELTAIVQKLIGGLSVCGACYDVVAVDSGAKGFEAVLFDPCNEYFDTITRHVLLRLEVLEIQVKIILQWEPNGKIGQKEPLQHNVLVVEQRDEIMYNTPRSMSALELRAGGTVEVVELNWA